jgi:hypothetical protein
MSDTTYFNSKTIGRSLKEVAVDLIHTTSEEVISRWYHSNMSVDLFTWVDRAENVIKQQLSFHGQVVEWNCLEGIKTGVVIESDVGIDENFQKKEGDENLSSETIKFDDQPQNQSVVIALDILSYTVVEEVILNQLISNFKEPKDIKNMEPEEFVKRFGISLKNYQNQDHGFWDTIKNTLNTLIKEVG